MNNGEKEIDRKERLSKTQFIQKFKKKKEEKKVYMFTSSNTLSTVQQVSTDCISMKTDDFSSNTFLFYCRAVIEQQLTVIALRITNIIELNERRTYDDDDVDDYNGHTDEHTHSQ